MRRIAILDAPSNLGLRPPTETSVPGCAKAPGALRDHDLVARLAARDAGCLTPPRYDPGDWRPGDGVCHAEQIAAYSVALADRIGSIIDAGEFPVVLGGDCSILLGSALAMHRQGEVVGGRIGLVFVDGHSDFRHPGNASYVGAAAGEDLALATGRGQADLAGLEGRRPYFRDVDVVVLGIRAQDEYRLDLQAAGIITRPVPALRVEGAARTAQWARDQLSDCSGYWVHIDVDVLDPAVMPAVDAPDPGGIAFAELELLLSGLVDTPRCLGVEITVFDPDYDPDGSYAAEIVETVVAGLSPVRMADPSPPPSGGPTPAAAPVSPEPVAAPVSPGSPAPAAAAVSPTAAPVSAPPAAAAVSLESEDPQAAGERVADAVAPSARTPLPSESDAGMASAATPAARVAAGSGFRTTSGPGGSTVEGAAPPPMLVDSAAAEVLAAAAAAAGIRKPPAARKAPDDETSVRRPTTADPKPAPGRESKPDPAGRAKPELTESTKTAPAGRPKGEPESRRKAGSLRRATDEPESGTPGGTEPAARPRDKAEPEPAARPRKAETDSGLRRKAESAWMDVAADLAARRGTPAARRPTDSGPVGLRRADDSGPVGLRRADDSGPATLRRGGEAESAWKDDPPPPASDDADPAAREDDQEPSGARDNGEGSAEGGVPVPAFEPFGPPAKAGPGRLRRSKKPPPAEIA
jgi:arginase